MVPRRQIDLFCAAPSIGVKGTLPIQNRGYRTLTADEPQSLRVTGAPVAKILVAGSVRGTPLRQRVGFWSTQDPDCGMPEWCLAVAKLTVRLKSVPTLTDHEMISACLTAIFTKSL
jgi:hypothetical protein